MDDDAVLARIFRRILTDEPGGEFYVSLNDDRGFFQRRPYLTLDGSTDQLSAEEYEAVKRAMEVE